MDGVFTVQYGGKQYLVPITCFPVIKDKADEYKNKMRKRTGYRDMWSSQRSDHKNKYIIVDVI